ncbi:MAG: PIG-L deacetylase family protein [Chloroflexota bacterium]|nr:PIG-L deacetylase family protein [Chloroflexota bacterium]
MKVLAIGAHFDDIELGCGGTLARHVAREDQVCMYVITDSEYRGYDGTMIRTRDVAQKEGQSAARILGVDNLVCQGLKTKELLYSVGLIEVINRMVDELEVDIVYTHWIHDVHQDHSAVGRATLNAARHVPRILMYRSNWYATSVAFNGSFFVDISPIIETKVAAIKAHQTEYRKYGDRWIDFVVHQNRNSGIEVEVEYAEVFEVVKYLW